MEGEEEYVGHEVYFLGDDPPQSVIDKLVEYGFNKSNDGFYIPRESLETFRQMAHPYRVAIMQYNIILGGYYDKKARWNEILDLYNRLKKAGVHGLDAWMGKLPPI